MVAGQGIIIAQTLRTLPRKTDRQPRQDRPEVPFQHRFPESNIVPFTEPQSPLLRTAAAQSGISLLQIFRHDLVEIVPPHVQLDLRQGFFVGIGSLDVFPQLIVRVPEAGIHGTDVKIRRRFADQNFFRLLQIAKCFCRPVKPEQRNRQICGRNAGTGGIGVMLYQFQSLFQTGASLLPLLCFLIEESQIIPKACHTPVVRRKQAGIEGLHGFVGGKSVLIVSGSPIGIGTVEQGRGVGNGIGFTGLLEQCPCRGSSFQSRGKLPAVPIEADLFVPQQLFAVGVCLRLCLCNGLGEQGFCFVQPALVQQVVQTGESLLYLHRVTLLPAAW